METLRKKFDEHLKWFEEDRWNSLLRDYDEEDLIVSMNASFLQIKERIIKRASEQDFFNDPMDYTRELWKLTD